MAKAGSQPGILPRRLKAPLPRLKLGGFHLNSAQRLPPPRGAARCRSRCLLRDGDHYGGYTPVLLRLSRLNPDVLRDLLGMAYKFVTRSAAPRSPARKLRKVH